MASGSGVPETEQNLFDQFQESLNRYYKWEEESRQDFLHSTGLSSDGDEED